MTAAQETVLLVEGDIVIRHALADYLRECGFTVVEAANGETAMEALTRADVAIDIVLADMSAEHSGFALREKVLRHDPRIGVVMTGSVEKAVDQAGALCNEGPALSKPYQHHLVLDHIRQVLARRLRARQG